MVIKCKSNKCLLIHVCSPNLITFCLFMRLLGGWGLPPAGCRAAAARAGAGVIRGYGFTRRAQTHPSGKAAAPGGRPRAARSGDARAGAARLQAARPAPPGRAPHQLPPESVTGKKTSACLFPYFYSWTFKKITSYSPSGSFCFF